MKTRGQRIDTKLMVILGSIPEGEEPPEATPLMFDLPVSIPESALIVQFPANAEQCQGRHEARCEPDSPTKSELLCQQAD